MLVLVADTLGHEFIADPDEHIVYVSYRLDGYRLSHAIASGVLSIYSGAAAVPGARRLNGHLHVVPDAS